MYGILKSAVNTGADSELQCIFAAPLSIYSNQPSYVQDSLNLKRKAGSQNVQRWEIETKIHPSSDASYILHNVLNGHNGIFYIRMPQLVGVIPSSGNIKTTTECVAGSTLINVSLTQGLKPGEFINFSNHSKVYLVHTSGTNGNNIRISPALQKNVPANTTIITGGKVTMLARYDTSVKLGITYIDGVLSDPGSIRLIEAL
jgi:hypothetical protein